MPDLVVGVDAGATTTRCLIVSTHGEVVGRGAAPGANLRSSASSPREPLAQALIGAVGGLDPGRIGAGVFGIAGGGAAGAETVGAAAAMAWWDAGLEGRPRVVTDLEVAFVSGSAAADGLLLLAGTGAAAASFAARRIVRRCDGYGWLLGDQGSAVWLGLRGVRAALDAHDGRGPETRLRTDLATYLSVPADDDLPQLLIARLHAAEPARLGALAPLVTRAAVNGDPVAAGLVAAAADRLVLAVRAVASGTPSGELVLAGALLADGPVRAGVLARLEPYPDVQVRDAGPGAAGAALLALADRSGGTLDHALHERVLRAAAL